MYTSISNNLLTDKEEYDEQYSVDRKALKRFVKKTLKTPLNQLDQDTRETIIVAQEILDSLKGTPRNTLNMQPKKNNTKICPKKQTENNKYNLRISDSINY